jgi:hypothetical protein
MSYEWAYPIYLVPLPGGYASVEEEAESNEKTHALVVYTDNDLCSKFLARFGITAQPKPLKNSREFAWLLQNIKPPVTRVAFDPAVEEADAPPRWSVGIPELLNDYLVIDYSPWNYPVYVLSQGEGFASIAGEVGEAGNGEGMHAVALFTDQQLAREYLLGAGETGSILALHDLQETRDFLTAIASGANSIAVNPIAEDGKRTAKHCFSIKTVLDKYLVRQK